MSQIFCHTQLATCDLSSSSGVWIVHLVRLSNICKCKYKYKCFCHTQLCPSLFQLVIVQVARQQSNNSNIGNVGLCPPVSPTTTASHYKLRFVRAFRQKFPGGQKFRGLEKDSSTSCESNNQTMAATSCYSEWAAVRLRSKSCSDTNKHGQRHNGPKALSTLTCSTTFFWFKAEASISFEILVNKL